MARSNSQTKMRLSVMAFAVGLACNDAAWAGLPAGAQVVSGSAQIGTAGSTMTVTNSPNAIINWQSFSVGQRETVKFLQQSTSSTVLNRVVGGQLSEIMGRLSSNGQVFLINPSGVLVGAGAVIDTASFFASTLQILDQDFLAGRLKFQGDASAGKIANQGWIRTGFGGYVVLIAPKIENGGIIEAPGGKILLAAGQKVTLTSLDLADLSFEVQAPTDSVLNLGQLIADGGVIKVFGGSLRHSGDIRANALTRDAAGEIVLKAAGDVELAAGSSTVANGRTGGTIRIESETGTARVAGMVSATGSSGNGGGIDVLGDKVVLTGNATLDASGAASGGVVRVGGDWQGANADVRNAQSAFVGAGVTLNADANNQGDGGRIVVWSEGNTRFLGKLSAQGGPNGGNGGNAEVSGKGDLLFIGGANLGAPKGAAGNLLLDPLDLFVDSAGGINPLIIDETTDFPANAVTVSPATLAGITGNVTLYASRDMRFNSAVTLAGAGQGLAASTGRDLQIGAGITTNGGAVSLSAARNLTTFAASPIATSGGNVTLAAQSISAGSMTVAAGTGAVDARSSAGALNLGTVLSSGSATLASSGGSMSLPDITSTGAVKLDSSSSLTANNIATGGGALSANATGGSLGISTVDTRLGVGPTGGAVTLVSTPSSISTGTIQAGNGNVNLSGTSVSTGTITTTGSVALTASSSGSGSAAISSSVDGASGVTANATSSGYGSASINISSTVALNASSITASAANCSAYYSCPSATINLSGQLGVNIGTVTALAPATSNPYATPEFQSRSRSVTIDGRGGPIHALGSASQITATDVTLRTDQGSGGGIGSAATTLNVSVDRNFSFQPNGEFSVALNGPGPNALDLQVGVAPTGLNYTGSLIKPGQITFNATANDTTVTANNFSITSGFDTPVFGGYPSIALSVPNGSLSASAVTVPKGDQVGFKSCLYYYCLPSIVDLPLTLQASGGLNVASFTREAGGANGKSTTFTAASGLATIGTVAGSRDNFSISGATGVGITSLATLGNVGVSSSAGSITVDRVSSGAGSVTMTANAGSIAAATDAPGVEITAAGSINLTAIAIGAPGNASPLDLAGGSISLTATGAGAYIGSGVNPVNPVTAATQNLTINTTGKFNVDTTSADLVNLTVTASPSGVGSGGLAQVKSDGILYNFHSDGTNFALGGSNIAGGSALPATQLAGGGLNFTATSGNLTLDNTDFSASGGSLAVRTNEYGSGNVAQTFGSTINLGKGALSINADGTVTLERVNAGGMAVSQANTAYFAGGCLGQSDGCGVASFTANQPLTDTAGGGGTWSATARGAVATGSLNVGGVDLRTYSGNITTGTIDAAGSVSLSAGMPYYYSYSAVPVSVTTGAIGLGTRPNTVNISAGNSSYYYYNPVPGSVLTAAIEGNSVSIASYGGGINVASNIGAITPADSVSLRADYAYYGVASPLQVGNIRSLNGISMLNYFGGAVTTGALNGGSGIDIRANGSAVTTGALDGGSINIGPQYYYWQRPASVAVNGAIGGNTPGTSVLIDSAGALAISGAVSLDPAKVGSVGLYSDTTVSPGGAITGGDGSAVNIQARNANIATPFQFSSINTGATGTVSITAPAGILESASGTGITAKTTTLSSTSAGSAIDKAGPAPLDLHGTTDLTLDVGGALNLDLHGSTLGSINVTKSDNAAAFSLNNSLGGGQSVTIADNAGTAIDVAVSSPASALNYTLYNSAGGVNSTGIGINGGSLQITANGAFTNTGIATNGGAVQIYSYGTFASSGTGITTNGGPVQITTNAASGTVATGPISTALTAGGGGAIQVLTYGAGSGITQSGDLTTGTAGGPVSLQVSANGSITRSGNFTIASDNQVFAVSVNGDVGSSGSPLQIASPNATLQANFPTGTPGVGNVYANLTGTTNLTLTADNDFSVASGTSLATLSVTTRGTGMGNVLSLSAPNQAFGFSRPATDPLDGSVALTNVFRVIAAGGATALANGSFSTSDGHLLVAGGTPFNVSNLTLQASNGDLRLEGTTASPLAISTASQLFSGQRIFVGNDTATLGLGNVSLTASGAQTLQSVNDLLVDARGGGVSISGGSQTLSSIGGTSATLTLRGGPAAGESVAVTSAGGQTIAADGYSGRVVFSGGTGAGSNVDVSATGSGQQEVRARGAIAFSGGAGPGSGSRVQLLTSGSGSQIVRAGGEGVAAGTPSVLFRGGSSDNSFVRVENSGSGLQEIGDSYWYSYQYVTPSVSIEGGSGAGSYVLLRSAGEQWITPSASINVQGGSGAGSYALINATQTGNSGRNQLIGHPGSSFYSQFPYSPYTNDYYHYTPSSITVRAGAGLNAYAEVSAAGQQSMYSTGTIALSGTAADGTYARVTGAGQYLRSSGLMSALAGTGNGADALIVSTGSNTQYLQSGALTLSAGGTAGANTAVARIVSGGSQQFNYAGITAIGAGAGPSSVAEVVASGSQNLAFSDLSLTGGSDTGAQALLSAGSGQAISAGTVLLIGGTGKAGGEAAALMRNAGNAQSLNAGNVTIRSGANYATAGIVNSGTTQNISAGNITIATSVGANNVIAPLTGDYAAGIVNLGSGAQTVRGNTIQIDNANVAGSVGIYAGNAQSVSAFGSLTVQSSNATGAARIASAGGTQTIGASGLIRVDVTGGAGTAAIDAVSGTQSVVGTLASSADPGQIASSGSANGGVRVQVSGGSGGTARIGNTGGGQTIIGAFVDINTSAPGTAVVSASADQTIHTTNGGASGGVGSLSVAAVGGGSASLSSGGSQLLQIDYPELMQAGQDGRITVGNGAALGSSRISAVNQDVFAHSITVLGGAVAGANAKIGVSGAQNISLVSSAASVGLAGGITVRGGAGGSALIDPLTQTIVSDGAISVAGGSGTGTVGGIIGTGNQTVLVTTGTPASIAVSGGSGTNAFGQITTSGSVQQIGTSGGITLSGGTGINSDAIIGASGGTAQALVACGSGSCNFTAIPSANNPFLNSTTDVGVYYNPLTVPLAGIIVAAAPVLPPPGSSTAPLESSLAPFDGTALVLWNPGISAPVDEEQRTAFLLRPLVPVCR